MRCYDAESCFNEIIAYFNSEVSGYPFIANIDDATILQDICSKMQADSNKKIIRVSDYCNGDNLPNESELLTHVASADNGVVLGLSSYYMLRGEQALKKSVSTLLQTSVHGHVVIIIYGCSSILSNAISADGGRPDHRTVILEKPQICLPKITLTQSSELEKDSSVIKGISKLFSMLENMSYCNDSSSKSELIVHTHYSSTLFKNAMMPVDTINGIFAILCRNHPEIKASLEQSWGTDAQWTSLSNILKEHGSLSAAIDTVLGSTVNLSMLIDDVFDDLKSEKAWYLWLAMKIFDVKENTYLSLAVKKSQSLNELIDLVYMMLLDYKHDDSNFVSLYKERKRIIEKLPDNSVLTQEYCDHVGKYEKNAIYYLTDLSYKEKRAFLFYLGKPEYSYTESEIRTVTEYAFHDLYVYLNGFKFDERNTPNPSNDTDLLSMLTDYFHDYKLQKVTNRIYPEFMEVVDNNAVMRPFTKLLPRISIVNDIDRSDAQIHFFDALGVEYLAFIIDRCKTYGLQFVIHVAHCELPSITSQNLEFKKFFKLVPDDNGELKLPGTKELDELKHHSKEFDYRKCKEPVHLFLELEIIDKELKQLKEMLINQEFKKIIIISDHGASRLSVIHQSECKMHTLECNGSHSGRCCPTSSDSNISEGVYENGFAILANYDRFKGGRPANVEVHGGATLEETVVPIIELTLKPEKTDIYFVSKYIKFHNKEIVSVVVHSNLMIAAPKLIIKGITNPAFSCECSCSGNVDTKHYKFDIPEIKRSGKFTADLYDGDSLIQQDMTFETKKAVGTAKDFFS